VDPITGERSIKIFNNDISYLQAQMVNNYGRSYAKLSYEINDHYYNLKNSLSIEENKGL
jgi:hypothetical protein